MTTDSTAADDQRIVEPTAPALDEVLTN